MGVVTVDHINAYRELAPLIYAMEIIIHDELTKEKWLELIHARVGEHQGGVVERHHRTAFPEGVLLLLHEEIDEG